ncbi:hypothetical protein [Kingella potus]|nr:hypothetical protein [Kingella potus]UOP01262.1 hypothetical protein LVJ84_03095 [Kingella potus]
MGGTLYTRPICVGCVAQPRTRFMLSDGIFRRPDFCGAALASCFRDTKKS